MANRQQEIRAQVLSDLGLSEGKYVVQLHVKGDCKIAVLPRHLDPNTTYQIRADTDERIVYAHVCKKSSADPDAEKSLPGEDDDIDNLPAQTLADEADEAGEAVIAHSNSITLSTTSKKSSLAPANKSKLNAKPSLISRSKSFSAPVNEPYEFYRIGTGSKEEITGRGIRFQIWLVAKVPKADSGQGRRVTLWSISTWSIAGDRVAQLFEAEESDFDLMPDSFNLDPAFQDKQDMDTISEFLFGITDGLDEDFDIVRSLSKNPKGKTEICRAPLIPTYARKDEQPDIRSKYGISANIVVAVNFQNHIDNQDLGLDEDFQVTLQHSDTCDSLLKYLLDGDKDWKGGLKKRSVLSKVKSGFEIELWVLPFGQDSMYCWTTREEWRACDWLDAELVKKYGHRHLYIEAHIFPASKDDKKAQVPRERSRSGVDSPDRLLAEIEEIDGDETVDAPNEKTSRKKRQRIVRDDEGIVDDDDEAEALHPALKRGKKPSKKDKR